MGGFDLILLALVVAFLFFRLYNTLGQEDSETQERIRQLQEILNQEKSMQTEDSHTPPPEYNEFLRTVPPSERKIIKGLWEQWPQFHPQKFVKGARTAFEMIVEGFAEGDLKSLKTLLSPLLFEQFKATIEERNKKGETHNSKVENIRTFRIVEATLVQNTAKIVVDIQSFQSYTIVDKSGRIIHETTEDLEELWDRWTFARDIATTSPAWRLVNIEPTPDKFRKEKSD